MFTEWGDEECRKLPFWRFAQTLWRLLERSLCGNIWMQMEATRECSHKWRKKKNPTAYLMEAHSAEHLWRNNIIDLTSLLYFYIYSSFLHSCGFRHHALRHRHVFYRHLRSPSYIIKDLICDIFKGQSHNKKEAEMPGLPLLKHLRWSHCTRLFFPWKPHQVGGQIWGRACRGRALTERGGGGGSRKAHKGEFADFKNHVLCISHLFLSRNVQIQCLQSWLS